MGVLASIYPTEKLHIGYNYQFGTESYGSSNIGNNTHEIGLGYRFSNVVKKKFL